MWPIANATERACANPKHNHHVAAGPKIGLMEIASNLIQGHRIHTEHCLLSKPPSTAMNDKSNRDGFAMKLWRIKTGKLRRGSNRSVGECVLPAEVYFQRADDKSSMSSKRVLQRMLSCILGT